MAGGHKIGRRGEGGTNGVEGAMDMGTEGRLVGMAATEKVITKGVKGFATGTIGVKEFRREAGKA